MVDISEQIPVPGVAAEQSGVFTVAQALDSGITYGRIRGHQRSGRWLKVLGRGWVAADQPIGVLQRCWAAHLTYPDAVVFGISALEAWHEIDPQLIPELPLHEETVWLASPSARHDQPGVTMRFFTVAADTDWDSHGLPLADPFESMTDALASLPEESADALFAWLAARRKTSVHDLEKAVDRYRQRTGRKQLTRYLNYARTGAASELEMRLHLLLNRAGIKGWKANAKVKLGRGVASADVLFEKAKLVIEADGTEFHSSSESLQRDHKRFRDLQAAGYRVLSFTWGDIVDNPAETLAEIRTALAVA
jgi:very-short-patch-repair endonuclease